MSSLSPYLTTLACERPDCPLCAHSTKADTLEDDIVRRVLKWALSNDTGTSSLGLASFMLGLETERYPTPPRDAGDRGRCIRLLNQIPEWWPRLSELNDAEDWYDQAMLMRYEARDMRAQ